MGGGAVVPTIVLTVLLIYGLAPIPVLLAPVPEGSLRIAVPGVVGPDLTHVGSRLSIGAGIPAPNKPKAFLHWTARTDQAKPGVLVPAFGMLPKADLEALAVYLEGLR